MKVRQGFVSNSSSSSFIVAGFFLDASRYSELDILTQLYPDEKPPEDEFDLGDWVWQAANREILVKAANGDNSLPKGTIFVGVLIDSENHEDSGLKGRQTFQDLESQVESIRLQLKFPKDQYPTELVTGTEAC